MWACNCFVCPTQQIVRVFNKVGRSELADAFTYYGASHVPCKVLSSWVGVFIFGKTAPARISQLVKICSQRACTNYQVCEQIITTTLFHQTATSLMKLTCFVKDPYYIRVVETTCSKSDTLSFVTDCPDSNNQFYTSQRLQKSRNTS